MGLFNKLMFWKKDPEMDFDKLTSDNLGSSFGNEQNQDINQDPLGLNKDLTGINEKSPFEELDKQSLGSSSFSQQPPAQSASSFDTRNQTTQASSQKRELELINSKLDTIKAILSSLDQRLANIEKSAPRQEQNRRLW